MSQTATDALGTLGILGVAAFVTALVVYWKPIGPWAVGEEIARFFRDCPECGKSCLGYVALAWHRKGKHGVLPEPPLGEQLCGNLRMLGVDAHLANHRLTQPPRLPTDSNDTTLAIIEISQSPIRWIQLLWIGPRWTDDGETGDCPHMAYFVPDSRPLPDAIIGAKTKKSGPAFRRKVVETRLQIEYGPPRRQRLALNRWLADDEVLKAALLDAGGIYENEWFITTMPGSGYWVIRKSGLDFDLLSVRQWIRYERVANRLLEMPL